MNRSAAQVIWIHPVFSPRYYGFYIEGLRYIFPGYRISIDDRPFQGWISPRDGMAVIVSGSPDLRLYFHANDRPEIYRRELRWCDAYGVVNLELSQRDDLAPEAARKVLALGPSFAVRLWGRHRALLTAARSFPKAQRAGLPRHAWRPYIGDFRGQARRAELAAYRPGVEDGDYVFFAATWWPREGRLNAARLAFAEACLASDRVRFEGGFTGADATTLPGPLVLDRRYPPVEYMRHLSRSAIAFNVPAVHGCHGWKLGEYLALGKAIISLPPERALPAALRHGEHLHIVGAPSDIGPAVERLVADASYRRSLAAGARRYWDEYLAPHRVMARMIDRGAEMVHHRDPRTLALASR